MILFNDKNDSKKEGSFGINAHCSPQEKAFLFILQEIWHTLKMIYNH